MNNEPVEPAVAEEGQQVDSSMPAAHADAPNHADDSDDDENYSLPLYQQPLPSRRAPIMEVPDSCLVIWLLLLLSC